MPSAMCALIYLANGAINSESWRSIGCYDLPRDATTKSLIIENIRSMERFKARYCFKHDITVCSLPLEIYGKFF